MRALRDGPNPNERVAEQLEHIADLLEAQDAELFRIRAYRFAAAAVRRSTASLAELLDQGGRPQLERIPGVGHSISASIEEYLRTGRIELVDRLEGHVCPEDILTRVPGIGPALAHQIHEELGVETLEQLEAAAHDGRLERQPGFGPRRIAAIRGVLGSMLRHRATPSQTQGHSVAPADAPPVSALLEIDEQYRAAAEQEELPMVAPTRFNPSGKAWLPILHTRRGRWRFTALYSNSARAHRLGKTHDWVVIFYESEGDEGQCTVVTEFEGELASWRVVRGREADCLRHYSEVHGWLWTSQGF